MLQQIIERIKQIKPRNAAYPGIVGVVAVITAVLFIYSARFLTTNINMIFTIGGELKGSEVVAVNWENYELAAKKLGLKIRRAPDDSSEAAPETQPPAAASSTPATGAGASSSAPAGASSTAPSSTVPTSVSSTASEAVPTSTPSSTTPAAPKLDKKTVSVAVWNSTTKKGLAADLKTALTAAGFAVSKTGNQTAALPRTTIRAKQKIVSERTLLEEARTVVSKKYDPGETETSADSAAFDIEIVIGVK